MITEIKIKGYRLLDDFEADLNPLTVVIGANAVGKSTLIDCLQLIAECSAVPVNTAMGWHGGAASLLTVGNRNRDLVWSITFHNPLARVEQGNFLVYGVILQADGLGQMHPKFEILSARDPIQGYSDPLTYLKATSNQRHIFDRKQGRLIPFDEAQSTPGVVHESDSAKATQVEIPGVTPKAADVVRESDSAAGTSKSSLLQPAQQESALLLSQIRFFNEFPVPSRVRILLESMAFYPGFDVTWSSTLRTRAADIKPVTKLSANGDNLGTVLHEILTRCYFRSAAEELRDFLRVAYPAFEEIHCDTTHGTPPQVLVGVREKGMSRSMNLWDLSDGMLRFLCLATALLEPRPSPLVAEMIKKVAWHRPASRKTLVEMLDNITGETLGDLHRSGELEAGV